MRSRRVIVLRALLLILAGTAAAILVNVALLRVARGDEPVGKLNPIVGISPTATVEPAPSTTGDDDRDGQATDEDD